MIRDWIRTIGLAVMVLTAASLEAQAQAPAPKPAKKAEAPGISPQEAFKKAQDLYDSGDWVKALAAFQKFEKDYPFSSAVPSAIFYEGWCWANQGRQQEAVNVLERLRTGTYSNNEIVAESTLKEAESYRELNKIDDALKLYKFFEKQYPKNELLPQAMLGEAWAYYKGHNVKAAKNIIAFVRQQFADNPEVNLNALFLLGQVLTEEKDFTAANQVYRLITRQRSNPRATEALYLAAEAMFNRGEALMKDHPDEARQAYRDAISYYKGVRSKAALVDALKKEMEALIASRGRIVADSGVDAFQRRVTALHQLMVQVDDRQDLRSLALFRVANCYQQLDMPEEASVIYEYLIDKYPKDPAIENFYDGLIQTLSARGEHEKSQSVSDLFQKKFPHSNLVKSASLREAEDQFALKNYPEALKSYAKVLTGSNTTEVAEIAEFRIATCYFNMGSDGMTGSVSNSPQATLEDFEKARDGYTAFAQKHPASNIRPDALFFLGLTHYEIANRSNDPTVAKTNIDSAIKAYEEIRAKYPKYDKLPLLTFKLGYLYSFAGAYDKDASGKLTSTANFDKAIATFQDYVKQWPADKQVPEAMYQIARNHLAAGRYDQAIAAYKELVEKFPDHDLSPYAAIEIATTYEAEHKPEDMVTALRAYVEKYPQHPKVGEALYAIATELEREKKINEAIPAYRDIIKRALASATLSDEDRSAAISAQMRVTSLLAQRENEKAVVEDCEEFLSKFANDAIAARAMVNEIATIYKLSAHPEDGFETLEQLSQQYQLNAPIRHACIINIIELAVLKGDMAKANASVARLLADPDKDKLPVSGFLAIGDVSLKTDKFAQAKESFEQVLNRQDNDAKTIALANYGLGQALLGLGQIDAAKTALEKAGGEAGYVPRADLALALGKVYESKGNLIEAVGQFSNALEGKGDPSFKAAYHLGNIFFNMVSDEKGNPLPPDKIKENKKQALAYYARLLFYTGPMAEEAAYRTTQCQEALGDLPRACAGTQGYLKRFPNGKFVEEAKAAVKRLCAPPAQ